MPDKMPETGASQADKKPDFGDPIDVKRLLALAKLDERDIESAVGWFDENASESWQGALE
jgi:hypothetical protein